jgi:nitroimidazol reductase NimA-like FMN-containing flavoprotein (pyridoxamine 5'-phosphate oxidase superfamily)
MTLDELDEYGMHRMDDEDIERTLERQSVGVLGISTDGAPMLRPLSYWYDGESSLYFVYVLGVDSQKAALSQRADTAGFLVYHIETTFNWRSVLLTGTLSALSDEERAAVESEMDVAWKPELFERAAESEATALYRFDIQEQAGIKQLERPG